MGLPKETEPGLYRYEDGSVIYLVPSNGKWRVNLASGLPLVDEAGKLNMFFTAQEAAAVLSAREFKKAIDSAE